MKIDITNGRKFTDEPTLDALSTAPRSYWCTRKRGLSRSGQTL